MSRLVVLQALQAILDTEFDRVYIYPDDYSTIANVPTLPFLAIEELPASENNTLIKAADWIDVEWTVSIYGYVAAGEMPAPGASDAAAKLLAYTARDTVRDLLESNMRPMGVSAPIGDDRRTFTDLIVPLQWNQKPYLGFYFEIPVTSG